MHTVYVSYYRGGGDLLDIPVHVRENGIVTERNSEYNDTTFQNTRPSTDISYRGLRNTNRCIIHHNIIAFLTSRLNKSALIYLIYPIASVPELNINNIHVYPINCWVQYERSPKLMKGNL